MPPKRKAAESSAAANKKAKLAEEGATQVEAILSDALGFAIPDDEKDIRAEMLRLAQYARSLEDEIASTKPKEKSDDEVAEEVEKLAAAVRSGIKKQLSVCFYHLSTPTKCRPCNYLCHHSGSQAVRRVAPSGSTMVSATTPRSLGSCLGLVARQPSRPRNSLQMSS
jgi:hypothetical protein